MGTAPADRFDVPGHPAAPFEAHAAGVGLAHIVGDHQHAVVGEEYGLGLAEGLDGGAGLVPVADRLAVVVVQDDVVVHERRRLVVHGRDTQQRSPDGAPARMVVDGDVHVVSEPVQLQVQGDGATHHPVAFEHLAVEVDPADMRRPQLVPAEVVGIDEQGAVGLLVADVAGDVLLVALAVEGPGQHGQLRPRRQGWDELLRGGLKPHVNTHLAALLDRPVAPRRRVCTLLGLVRRRQ